MEGRRQAFGSQTGRAGPGDQDEEGIQFDDFGDKEGDTNEPVMSK